jgi:hypothetical protein
MNRYSVALASIVIVFGVLPANAERWLRTLPSEKPHAGAYKWFDVDSVVRDKKRLLDVSNGFEEISEWGGEQVDDGDVGCGISVSSGTGPCGLEDAVQALEAGVGVG